MAPPSPPPALVVGGLQLHVATEPDALSGAVYLWFDVGSIDEGPDEVGAAHFLEHMLFKGTARLDIGEAAARIEGMGGDLNAWTSADELVLHAVVPAGDTLEALDVLLDMASRPRMDPEEVERERQVILDEIRGYADDTETVASEALQASMFRGHAYGRPVLGTEPSVSALRHEQLQAFHRRHIHPGRALLAVTSPLPLEAVRERLLPALRDWPKGAARAPLSLPSNGEPGTAQRLRVRHGGATVHFGSRTPGHGHADLPALDVLAAALGQGAAALLPQALELQAGVASGTWAALSTQRAGGALELGFQVGQTEEAVPLALDVLDGVVRDGIDGERVSRAIDGMLCDLRFSHETVDGRTSDQAFQLAVHGDPYYAERQRQRLAAVTPEDVHEVARKVLLPERRHLVVLDQEVAPAKVRRWHARRLPPAPVRRDTPEVVNLDGLTAVLLPDGAPLGAIHIHMGGGQLLEPERVAGLSRAWAGVVTRGAGPWDATGFASRADALAMVLDGYAGRASMGLAASLPADRLLQGLELALSALVDPHLDPVDVDHLVEELMDDEAALHDRASAMAQEALHRALFPGHPWGRPAGGTPSSLDRIRSATLRRLHERAVVRRNVVVAVAGGRSSGAVLRRLEALSAALPDRPSPGLSPPGSALQSVRHRGGGQTQGAVVMGVRVEAHTPERRQELAVLAALLDSQSGRLFMELREARGLAYGVWAAAEVPAGQPQGAFTLGLTVDPSRADEAREALERSWRRLLTDGPEADELTRTTRMLAGHAALARERVAGRARAMVRLVVAEQPYPVADVRSALLSIDKARLAPVLEELAAASPRVAVALPEDESS